MSESHDPSHPLSGQPVACAVELEQALARARSRLQAIEEVGRALVAALDLDQLLRLVMERVTTLLEAERSTLYLLDEERGELWSKVAQGEGLAEIHLPLGEGIAGHVAESGMPLRIDDAYADPRFHPEVDRRSGFRTRSVVCVPMRNRQGALLGVIQSLNRRGGSFSLEDEALLASLAAQAAVSVENARLYQSVLAKNVELLEAQARLQQKVSELDLLYALESETAAATDLGEMLERLLSRAMVVLAAEAGAVLLRDEDRGELTFRTAAGPAGEAVRRLRIPLEAGVCGWVTRTGSGCIVDHPEADPRHDAEIARRVDYQPRNLVCVPLADEDGNLGAIELLNRLPPGSSFGESDLRLLTLIGGQAARAIRRAQQREVRAQKERLATIGQMLSGLLHDVRTPMTIASGYVQLMDQSNDPQARSRHAAIVGKQFELMETMAREVLQFARGQRSLLVRKVYVHKFFEQVGEHLGQLFAGRNIELRLEAGYRDVAYFDEIKLLRVIHNLGRNAAEAMPQGGLFRASVEADGEDLVWRFADSGSGIAEDLQVRLFRPFLEGGKRGGFGLGLALVKKIVEEHQGEVSCASQPGCGTTFTIRMPLRGPAGAAQGDGRSGRSE